MQKLLQGLQHFQTNIFGTQRELFERLTEGQSPEVLFITCSDSRINPNLLTQTEPGELSGLSQGMIKLHGWVYKIETGEVYGYDPEICQFKVLTEQRKSLSLPDQKFVAQEI
jgi:carbonic anhydrase